MSKGNGKIKIPLAIVLTLLLIVGTGVGNYTHTQSKVDTLEKTQVDIKNTLISLKSSDSIMVLKLQRLEIHDSLEIEMLKEIKDMIKNGDGGR